MPKTITFEGTRHTFPDDFTDADISAALSSVHPAPMDRIAQGVEDFDRTKAAFEAQPSKSFGESVLDAGKDRGSAIVAPIAGSLDAVREGISFLGSPNEWAKRHFDPQQAGTAPGAPGNPVNEAVGLVEAAVPVAKGEIAAKRGAILDRFGVAAKPKPAVVMPDAAPGLARKVAERVARRYPTVKAALLAVDIAKAVKDVLGENAAPAVEATAEAVAEKPALPVRQAMRIEDAMRPTGPAEAIADTPGAAQIPANVSPAEMMGFKPQQVIEMQQQAKPVLAVPETPAEAVAMPTKRTRSPKKAAEPEVQTIPAPEPKYTPEQFSGPARAAKAGKLANLLNEHGITVEDAANMGPSEWKAVSEAAGVRVPSAESVKATLSELQKLEKTSSVVSKNPRALKIAQELADSMMQ